MIYELIGSGLPAIEIFALIVAYCVAMILSFGLHEFSHAYVSYKLGDPTPKALGRLTLNPIKHIDPIGFFCLLFFGFGWAKPVEVNPLHYRKYKKGMFLVSISGVATNLCLAFVATGIWFFVTTLLISTNLLLIFINYFLYFMIILNLSLFAFNLLPIYPLDGFNCLKTLLPPGNKFIEFIRKHGTIILLIVIITPIFEIIYSFVTVGLLNIFCSFWGLFV